MVTAHLDSVVNDMALTQLNAGQRIRFVARGRSMWPFVLDGDSVSVGPLNGTPRLGDVVFLPNEDFGQLHRVVAESKDGYVCLRGDALPTPDGWVALEEIKGILIEQRRNGRLIAPKTGPYVVKIAQTMATCRRGVHLLRSFFGFR